MIWLGMKLLIESQTFWKSLQQNNSQAVTNEHHKEIPKEKYIFPEERQEIIDELILKKYNNAISKVTKRQLQMRMIKKYLKKSIYLQKKGKKLLII